MGCHQGLVTCHCIRGVTANPKQVEVRHHCRLPGSPFRAMPHTPHLSLIPFSCAWLSLAEPCVPCLSLVLPLEPTQTPGYVKPRQAQPGDLFSVGI